MMAAERGKTRFLQWREIKQSRHGPGCSSALADTNQTPCFSVEFSSVFTFNGEYEHEIGWEERQGGV